MEELYLHLRQEQDARVQRANSAPLPTCCESNGYTGIEGCKQGELCPEGRVEFADGELYEFLEDMAVAARTVALVLAVVLVCVFAALAVTLGA
jgi:hypothetical protein